MLAPLLGSLLALAPGSAETTESTPAPSQGERERERESIAGGWLQIAPLGFAIPGPGASSDVAAHRRAVRAGFRWGFAAGASFEPVPHLFVNLTGGFEQAIWLFRNVERDGYQICFRGGCYGWDERGVGQLMRLGPELRLGWTSRWLLAWAQLGGHVGISRIRLDCNNSVEDHCDRAETDVGPGLGGGLGLAARPTPRMALGLEASVDHTWVDRRDDPFTAVRSVDLALIVALRF